MDNSKAAEILEWYLEHENLSEEEKQAFQMAVDALSAKRKRKPQKYPCQNCKERHAGCHANCAAYLEARERNQAESAEERKKIEKQLDFVRYKIESRDRAKRQSGKTKKY